MVEGVGEGPNQVEASKLFDVLDNVQTYKVFFYGFNISTVNFLISLKKSEGLWP